MYIFIVLILLHADHRGNIWDSQSFVCSKMFTSFWISSSKALPFKGVFNQFKSWGLSYSWKCIKKVYTAKVKKKMAKVILSELFLDRLGELWYFMLSVVT